MKKIKIVPFLISVLFPLVCTAFVVCYSYGVKDIYTVNKQKYEAHVQNEYYDENGQATDEIEKAVKFDSHKYGIVDQHISNEVYINDAKSVLYGYTTIITTTDEDGEEEKHTAVAYSLYLYDIIYKNTYKDVNTFETTSGVYLQNNGNISALYVKGVGGAADVKIEEALEELKENGSTSTATMITADKVTVKDNNAQNFKETDDLEEAPVYRVSLFNSEKDTSTDSFLDMDLEELYPDEEDVEEGYTVVIVNYYSGKDASHAVKELYRFNLDTLQNGEDFEKLENSKIGYNQDVTKLGKSYISYVFPTLLWQGALTLVVTGILGFLFYAIWQADPQETEEQRRIKILQQNKKSSKKTK